MLSIDHLLWVTRNVQTLVHAEHGLFEEGKSLGLPLLTLVEDQRHVLYVLRVVLGDVPQGQVVPVFRALDLLLGFCYPVRLLFYLAKMENRYRQCSVFTPFFLKLNPLYESVVFLSACAFRSGFVAWQIAKILRNDFSIF